MPEQDPRLLNLQHGGNGMLGYLLKYNPYFASDMANSKTTQEKVSKRWNASDFQKVHWGDATGFGDSVGINWPARGSMTRDTVALNTFPETRASEYAYPLSQDYTVGAHEFSHTLNRELSPEFLETARRWMGIYPNRDDATYNNVDEAIARARQAAFQMHRSGRNIHTTSGPERLKNAMSAIDTVTEGQRERWFGGMTDEQILNFMLRFAQAKQNNETHYT